MNIKVLMVLMIIIIGLSFGCVDTSPNGVYVTEEREEIRITEVTIEHQSSGYGGENINVGPNNIVQCGDGCNIDTGYNCVIECGSGCNIDCGDNCDINCGIGCNIRHGERCNILHGSGCNIYLAYPD